MRLQTLLLHLNLHVWMRYLHFHKLCRELQLVYSWAHSLKLPCYEFVLHHRITLYLLNMLCMWKQLSNLSQILNIRWPSHRLSSYNSTIFSKSVLCHSMQDQRRKNGIQWELKPSPYGFNVWLAGWNLPRIFMQHASCMHHVSQTFESKLRKLMNLNKLAASTSWDRRFVSQKCGCKRSWRSPTVEI